jgi:hypothetical protein
VVSELIPAHDLASCALALAFYLALISPIYVALARILLSRPLISVR